jgi:hypothetical protein
MQSSLNIRAIVISLLCLLIVVPNVSAQKAKLTRIQLEQLIRIQQPDDVTASLIRSRGLGFPVTRKIVDALAAKGAKQLTVAALREQIHLGKGTMEVHTEAGSRLILDGREIGYTGASGLFVLQDLVEGDHELVAKKEGYREVSSKFSLENNENKQIPLLMEWQGGFLSVSIEPSDATIQVTGPRSFNGAAKGDRFPPGNYTITASENGYETQTHTFHISAGEHHSVYNNVRVA